MVACTSSGLASRVGCLPMYRFCEVFELADVADVLLLLLLLLLLSSPNTSSLRRCKTLFGRGALRD